MPATHNKPTNSLDVPFPASLNIQHSLHTLTLSRLCVETQRVTRCCLKAGIQHACLHQRGFKRSLAGRYVVVRLHEDSVTVAPDFLLQSFLDGDDVCREVCQLVEKAALADDAVD